MKTKTRTRSDWSALSVHTLVENRRRKIASSCCCVHSAGLCVMLNANESVEVAAKGKCDVLVETKILHYTSRAKADIH